MDFWSAPGDSPSTSNASASCRAWRDCCAAAACCACFARCAAASSRRRRSASARAHACAWRFGWGRNEKGCVAGWGRSTSPAETTHTGTREAGCVQPGSNRNWYGCLLGRVPRVTAAAPAVPAAPALPAAAHSPSPPRGHLPGSRRRSSRTSPLGHLHQRPCVGVGR